MKTNPRLRLWCRHRGGVTWMALVLVAGLELGLLADGVRSWQWSLQGSRVTPAPGSVTLTVDPGTVVSNPGHYL
jgi:hypothetical protein